MSPHDELKSLAPRDGRRAVSAADLGRGFDAGPLITVLR
jgi:hypothetical protein